MEHCFNLCVDALFKESHIRRSLCLYNVIVYITIYLPRILCAWLCFFFMLAVCMHNSIACNAINKVKDALSVLCLQIPMVFFSSSSLICFLSIPCGVWMIFVCIFQFRKIPSAMEMTMTHSNRFVKRFN